MNLSLNTFKISFAREIKRGQAVRVKTRSNPASATVR